MVGIGTGCSTNLSALLALEVVAGAGADAVVLACVEEAGEGAALVAALSPSVATGACLLAGAFSTGALLSVFGATGGVVWTTAGFCGPFSAA